MVLIGAWQLVAGSGWLVPGACRLATGSER